MSDSVAAPTVSPYAAAVSIRAGAPTGTVVSSASVFPPSEAVMRTRASPVPPATAANRTAAEPPPASATRAVAAPVNARIDGSRLSIVTVASPPSSCVLLTVTPMAALSPRVRNRGRAASSVTGFDTRISVSPEPKRDAVSPATAMIR